MRILVPAFLLAALVPAGVLVACGSSPSSNAVVSGDDAGDAAPIQPGDDAAPASDAPSEGSDASPGTDAGDADVGIDASGPPFACGPTLICPSITAFCGQVTGPHGGTFYTCDPAPASCATDVTCACLLAQGVVSPCSVLDGGGVLVVAQEP